MWDSFQNLLAGAAGKYNFRQTLKAIEVCREFRSLASKMIRPDASKNIFPKNFQDQTLTIGVYNSAWAQQLQLKKHLIQQELNKKFGKDSIQNLRIEMSEKPTERSS